MDAPSAIDETGLVRHATVTVFSFFLLVCPFAGSSHAQVLSGGIDIRGEARQHEEPELVLEGLFLNYRQVFGDELGDRWIVVVQGDADHNLEKVRPYQTYVQYKGPLGRWNVRAGHFILPFGLLADHDTERLVLNGIEEQAIGIKLDTGLEALGYTGAWDWAVSVTSGVGRRWPDQPGGHGLAVARLARGSEAVKTGLSLLAGTIETADDFPLGPVTMRQRKAALDVAFQRDRWSVRAEGSTGTEDGNWMGSGVVLATMGLRAGIDLDAKYAVISRSTADHTVGLGASLHLGHGWIVRPAAITEFTTKETTHGLVAQVYYDFSKNL